MDGTLTKVAAFPPELGARVQAVWARPAVEDSAVFGGGTALEGRSPRNDIRNCALIRSKTAPTKPEWMSGFCDAHREPQDRARPAGWQSCLGILPKPPENTNSVPQRPRDDAEHAQGSARRPSTQSHQLPPARASSIDAYRCLVRLWCDFGAT